MEAELQAYPYETLLKDEMIERSAEEVKGPFCAMDIDEKEPAGNTEGANRWEDYSSYDEYDDCGYDHRHHEDNRRQGPEERYHERYERRQRIPDPQPGTYTDRRERERYEDDRSPLRRHKGCGRKYERI